MSASDDADFKRYTIYSRVDSILREECWTDSRLVAQRLADAKVPNIVVISRATSLPLKSRTQAPMLTLI